MGLEAEIQAVKVHIVGTDIKPPAPAVKPSIRTVVHNVVMDGLGGIVQVHHLLNLAPNRCKTTITVVAQSVDIVYLCTSYADGLVLNGSPIMGLQVVTLYGSNELHIAAAAGVSALVGVIADYES